MPKIKIDHVVSFSSEDSVHIANNILSADPAKKWKCKSTGERSATIVLQLEKASVISAIDIGNENSAYIEVLVGRSGGSNDDYKVLLVMSSFMTPLEARQSTNPNKVRMFGKDDLSSPECDQKWDRVRIVCTQPFNRHVQYGLSFINLQSSGDDVNGSIQTIGKFILRPESPDNLTVGSLFAKRDVKRDSLSTAAAIREASSSTASPKPKLLINSSETPGSSCEKKKPLPRNRNEILYNKDEEDPNEKIDQIIEKKEKEKTVKKENEKTEKEKAIKRKSDFDEKTPIKKKKHNEESSTKKNKKVIRKKPFHELLKGVTLIISGIQNPDRGMLRTKALEMGAKYKPDWDASSTHLICAFANTPKFNQVKGKGKIVKRTWIEDCYSQRKFLPWRRYSLDKSDGKQAESEEEILEESETEEEGYDDTSMQRRIDQLESKQSSDIFNEDTDEEVLLSDTGEISKKLPDFLDSKKIYIDGDLDDDVSGMLERYVIAYKGIIAQNPSENVDYCITSETKADVFKTNNDTNKVICVRPDWLWDCHNSQKIVSTSPYLI